MPASCQLPNKSLPPWATAWMQKPQGGGKFLVQVHRGAWGGMVMDEIDTCIKISESVRANAYLILSLQASVRSGIVAKTASTLTARNSFLNNFEDIVNRRVNIWEDIKRYQDTLSYASSKADLQRGRKYLHVA